MLFINLPVQDLARSTAFYEALGFEKNPDFSDENATCVVFSDSIFAMLLVRPYFSTFIEKPIAETTSAVAALYALSSDDRASVDEFARRALSAGGKEPTPARDVGFMYTRTIEDPDGHTWEFFHMDGAAAQG
jgi:predicted lactoylglutathione lyase